VLFADPFPVGLSVRGNRILSAGFTKVILLDN
jgi:hypothetical protein